MPERNHLYYETHISGDRLMTNEILEILEVEEMEEVVAPGLLLGD